jgi:hypothetical protein
MYKMPSLSPSVLLLCIKHDKIQIESYLRYRKNRPAFCTKLVSFLKFQIHSVSSRGRKRSRNFDNLDSAVGSHGRLHIRLVPNLLYKISPAHRAGQKQKTKG